MSTVEAGRRPQAPGGRRGQMFVRSESLSFQGFPLTQTTRVAEGAFYFFTIRVARGALNLLEVHVPSARPYTYRPIKSSMEDGVQHKSQIHYSYFYLT